MAQVLDSGEVGAVETVASTLPGLGLEEAASAAVKQWRYAPALADGLPVETRVRVFVTFR
jgi:TonB family protein